jgi:hypothetical protein
MEFKFTQRMVNLMLHIKNHGFVTMDTRPFLSSYRYNKYIWMLRDYDLIVENGCDAKNQKKWILTDKGQTFSFHLKLMRDLLGLVQKG